MDCENAFFEIVSTNAGVTALIGAGDDCRMYPSENIPQDERMPAIAYRSVGGAPTTVLEGVSPADHDRIRVDAYAETRDGALALAEAVRTAAEARQPQIDRVVGIQCVAKPLRDYEPDTRRYRCCYEYSIWTERTV